MGSININLTKQEITLKLYTINKDTTVKTVRKRN